jgi:hypothetical protein
MSFNLVDLISSQFGGPALGQLGALLGEDSNKTESALGAAIPGLLNGITGSAQADGGASLFDTINKQDDSILDNIGGMLTGGNTGNIMQQGSGILSSLLGNGAVGGLASAISAFTGMGGKSSSGLMGILTPIILSLIKRKLFGGGGFNQNAGGLMSLLDSQKTNVQAAMPSGFADQLKTSGFMDQMASFGENVSSAASDTVSNIGNAAGSAATGVGNAAAGVGNAAGDAAASGGGFLRKLLPIAVLVAIALLGWRFLTGNKAPDVSDAASNAASATADAAKAAIPSIDVDGTDLGASFGDIFSSATDTVKGITDVDSAKAAIPSFEDITGKVDNLGGLWDKVPEAGRGQLGGMVTEGIGKLTPALEQVNELPGVSDVIGPVTSTLLEKLQAFTQ